MPPKPKPYVPVKPKPAIPAAPKIAIPPVFFFDFKIKALILILLAFIFYSNTLPNDYLLDDNLAIVENDYVQQGISGIPNILTQDSYISWMHKTGMDKHKLSSGRYRPLSIVVFAIEHSIFGESPVVRHLMQIICLCCILITMLWFLDKYLFKSIPGGSDMAFLATVLFAIHPVHVEVVANIKSLDEMLSLLFILLTFIFSLRYVKQKKITDLIIGLLCYFFCLMSKEYGMVLLILLPVLFYLLCKVKPVQAILFTLPYCLSLILYWVLRIHAVGPPENIVIMDVAINPFTFATHSQALATKFFVLGKYILLLFFPYPLTYDYNYSQIPYHNFSNLSVWICIFIYAAIIIWALRLLFKKKIIAFAVIFFLLNIFLVSNLVMDISSLMGERLIFHASFGFVMILSYVIITAIRKLPVPVKRAIIFSSLGVISVACGAETIHRNKAWKDFPTLATTDVYTSPNSVIANDYAALSFTYLAGLQKDSIQRNILLHKAVSCAYKSTQLLINYFNGNDKLAIAYEKLNMPDSAIYYYQIAGQINPYDESVKQSLARLYVIKGFKLGSKGDMRDAIALIKEGINETPNDAGLWYNLGISYYNAHIYDSARYAWTKALQLKPGYTEAENGLKNLQHPAP